MGWLDLLHIADSSFPSGAYVHSWGLETLAPSTAGELHKVLCSRITESLARFELVFLRHAYVEPVEELDARLDAMLFAREPREASRAVGTSLLRAACELHQSPTLYAFLESGPHRHVPIVFGAIAMQLEVEPALAAETYAFQSLRASVSVMQRLGKLGQREAQQVLHRLKPAVQSAVVTACSVTLEDAGAFAPAWDIAAMQHERAPVRMFAS
jgi:urease accessory protein